MVSSLIRWMKQRGCFRMICRRNQETGKIEKYIHRGYIFRSSLFGLYIHQFWSSDPDHPHTHPWWNYTLVLTGGYHEFDIDGTSEWRGPGFTRFRQALVAHRISIGPNSAGSAWSLFAHGKRRRPWGFLTPDGWIESGVYGDLIGNPVEKEGVDYKIVGYLFPKVVHLKEVTIEGS